MGDSATPCALGEGVDVAQWSDLLEEVVRTRRVALVGYACLLTLDRRQADDLVQEALVRTFARRRSLSDVHDAEAYVRSAMRTAFLDDLRRRRTRTDKAHLLREADTRRSPDETAVTGVDVRSALAALPARERACIVLRYIDDLTVADVAAGLGVSQGAVKRYLSDGTKTLRAVLGDDAVSWPAEGDEPTVPVAARHERSGR